MWRYRIEYWRYPLSVLFGSTILQQRDRDSSNEFLERCEECTRAMYDVRTSLKTQE